MFWKYRRPSAAAAALLLAATLLGACGTDKPNNTDTSVEVKAGQSGTYRLGDLTIAVPAHAVAKDTKLVLSRPKKPMAAPFGAANAQFDLGFAGDVEPKEPLDVSIPLSGAQLPKGANYHNALLYTLSRDGNGVALVPSTIKDGTLHASLWHLSPKMLAYPTGEQLLAAAGIKQADAQSSPGCKTSVTVAAGKVVFTDASKGWDNKKGSPIDACLSSDNGTAKLTVTSNVDFMLDVATGGLLKLSGDAPSVEDHAIERITKAMFPDSRVNAYLPSDDSFNVSLPPASLPATVELRANHDTFLAQAAWNSLKFLVAVASAKSGDELVNTADDVLGLPDKLDCITSSLKAVVTKQPSLKDVFDAIAGPCAGEILGAVQNVLASESNIFGAFFKRLIIPIQGVITAGQTLWTAFTGIRLQFVGANGTMRIVVGIARTPTQPTAQPTSTRKLPEVCTKRLTNLKGWSVTSASVVVLKGSVSCEEAVAVAGSFLSSEIGSSGANRVGIWDCGLRLSDGIKANCTSSKGAFAITSE